MLFHESKSARLKSIKICKLNEYIVICLEQSYFWPFLHVLKKIHMIIRQAYNAVRRKLKPSLNCLYKFISSKNIIILFTSADDSTRLMQVVKRSLLCQRHLRLGLTMLSHRFWPVFLFRNLTNLFNFRTKLLCISHCTYILAKYMNSSIFHSDVKIYLSNYSLFRK